MLDSYHPVEDSIDLREIFAVLWSHKLLIGLVAALSFCFANLYVVSIEKKYTATVIFKIDQERKNSIQLPSELGSLASFAGLGEALNSDIEALLERISGREFILIVSKKTGMQNDSFFNSYKPKTYNSINSDPYWRTFINNLLQEEGFDTEKTIAIENEIINKYKNFVQTKSTDGGAISVSVTHPLPDLAAKYANAVMEEMRVLVENENKAAQDKRLSYLSETLAGALQDMEKAQENLKNYALENSALAQENFISDSLKLDQIRMEQRKVKEIADLLSIIEDFIKSGNLDENSYKALRLSHPLVDDIEFRRILGMSETISAWTWPDIDTIDAVSATLKDRIKRLDVDISKIEENAQIYATSAEDLAKYQRDAKIAEATYTVLIEQVKSQSLAAGFQPDTFKVFEYATSPLSPSSPNRIFFLALGTALGLFIGCALSLINSTRRGVYYTRSALLSDTNADLALKSKPIRRLARGSFTDVATQVSKQQITVLSEADLKLASKNIIYIMSAGGQMTASNAARLIATQSAQSGRNVVLCDTTGQIEKEINETVSTEESTFSIRNINESLSVITGVVGSSFFTSKNLEVTIKDLVGRFDQVFICTSNKDSQLGLMALQKFSPGLVMISSLRKTKKADIKNIKSRQPIDLLFHD